MSTYSPDRHGLSRNSTASLSTEEKNVEKDSVEGFFPLIPASTRPGPRNIDGGDLLNLPSRILSNGANLEEFTEETVFGQIAKRVKSNKSGKIEDYELVTFTIDDPENPKNWSKPYKWWCTMVVAVTCFVVAFNSAVITADLEGVSRDFHVSEEVSLLTITL